MAVDVLAYNEIARTNALLQCVVDQCVGPGVTAACTVGKACGCCAATDFVNAAVTAQTNSGAASYIAQNPTISTTLQGACFQTNYGTGGSTCELFSRPWDCTLWNTIPTLTGTFTCLCVYDTTYGRCGVCCLWTVPAGVTTARFQIWGAGGGASGACATSFAFGQPGSSGAYASVILPVTAGSTYTLCAGCAMCCYAFVQGIGGLNGSSSWVTGNGLCNFCADGGDSNGYNWICRMMGSCGTSGICVLFSKGVCCSLTVKGTYPGFCLCSGGWFCTSGGGCNSSLHQCWSTSCNIPYGCVTNGTSLCHYVAGAPGMYPFICQYFACALLTMPPVIGCCAAQNQSVIICCGACSMGCAYAYPCAYPFYSPGQGGIPTVAFGSAGCSGSPGAGGMVIVHYN